MFTMGTKYDINRTIYLPYFVLIFFIFYECYYSIIIFVEDEYGRNLNSVFYIIENLRFYNFK